MGAFVARATQSYELPGVLTMYVIHHTQQYYTQAGFITELTRPITR